MLVIDNLLWHWCLAPKSFNRFCFIFLLSDILWKFLGDGPLFYFCLSSITPTFTTETTRLCWGGWRHYWWQHSFGTPVLKLFSTSKILPVRAMSQTPCKLSLVTLPQRQRAGRTDSSGMDLTYQDTPSSWLTLLLWLWRKWCPCYTYRRVTEIFVLIVFI